MAGGTGPVLVIGATGQQGGAAARALLIRCRDVLLARLARADAVAFAVRAKSNR